MIESILHSLTPFQWFLIVLCAALIGANKTGLEGVFLLTVPVFALIYGGKSSTGIIAPLLVAADMLAVLHYFKYTKWKKLLLVLPFSIAGIAAATAVGNMIPDTYFKKVIAFLIFIMLILMVIKEFTGKEINLGHHWYLTIFIGFIGGFTSMIGNAAGPILSIYFLSLNMEKNEFIATKAWCFWIINVTKVIFHFTVWHTVTTETLLLNGLLLPAIAAGAFVGIHIVKKIPERAYKILIITVIFISSIFLII